MMVAPRDDIGDWGFDLRPLFLALLLYPVRDLKILLRSFWLKRGRYCGYCITENIVPAAWWSLVKVIQC